MTNFNLIDDYLTNRLSESEKVAFELQLTSNPSLKADVELQKNILNGIKSARASELKAMLNNVPIGTSVSVSFSAMKMAAGIIGAGILIGSLYYYFQPKGLTEGPNLSTSIQDSVQGNDSVESTEKIIPADASKQEHNIQPVLTKPSLEKATESKNENKKTSTVSQPKLEIADPTNEFSSEDKQVEVVITESSKSPVTLSHMQVETNSSSKKYSFHYQFINGKLQLYGPFDKSLYEILEINGDSHSVFLFYRENYYLLDESQIQITQLPLIKDGALLEKLKEYRNQ